MFSSCISQADGLGGMVNEIVQGLIRQQNPHLQTGQESGANQSTGQSSTTGAPGSNPVNPFANLFTNITGAQPGNTPPNPPRTHSSSQSAEPSFVEAFRNILQQGNVRNHISNLLLKSCTPFTAHGMFTVNY